MADSDWPPYLTVSVHFFQELIATMVFLVSLDRIGMYFFNLPIGASILLMSILLVFVFPHLNPYISVLLFNIEGEYSNMTKWVTLFARIGAQMLAGFLAGSLLEYNYVDLEMNKGYVARIKYNTTMRPEDTTQAWAFPMLEELFAVFTFLTLIGWIIYYYTKDDNSKIKTVKDALNIYMAVCVSFALTLFAFPTARLSPAAYLSEWADKSNVVLPGGNDYKLLDDNKNTFLWVRFAGGIFGTIIALLLLMNKQEFFPKDLKPTGVSLKLETGKKVRDDYIPMTLFKKG